VKYPAEGTFTLARLLKVRDRARAAFTPFTDFDAPRNVPFDWSGETLPRPADLPGIHFWRFYLSGRLRPAGMSLEPFAAFARRAWRTVARKGFAFIACEYKRKDGPGGRHSDEVDLTLRSGKAQFGFHLDRRGQKSHTEAAARQAFYKHLISVARLPLAIGEGGDELKHTAGGEMFVSVSDWHGPTYFRCDVPGASLADLIERAAAVVRDMAAPRPYILDWLITPGDTFDADHHQDIYEQSLALTEEFSTCKHYYHGHLTLPSLEAIERVRRLCSPREPTGFVLCRFGLPAHSTRGWANGGYLEVSSSTEGHRLRLNMTYRDEARLPEIGRALGLRFLTK
jgi:hypothetical protein